MAEKRLDILLDQAAAAHRNGDLITAEKLCRNIITEDPQHLRALYGLATIEFARGNYTASENLLARVLAIDPTIVEAHHLRGLAFVARGQLPEAADSFGKAAALSTEPAPALYNQGNIFFELGKFEEALHSYDEAIACEPDFPVSHNNRGNALRALNRPAEALTAYDRALLFDPNYSAALNNRGIVLQELGRNVEALASLEQACALSPNDAEIHYNLGVALSRLNRPNEALGQYDRAISLKPDYGDAASAAFSIAGSLCDWDDYDHRIADLMVRIEKKQRIAPFVALTFADDPVLQAKAAITTARSFSRLSIQTRSTQSREPHSRIRLAYVSADFGNHVVGHTLIDLLEHHDKKRFEIWGVSLRSTPESMIRRRLTAVFDHFIDVSSWSTETTANFLRRNEIDIAIDLMGHTEHSRFEIFAYRAAPLQISYFGYPGTGGSNFIDYIIADRIALPQNLGEHFTECVVYLPDCYLPAASNALKNEPTPIRKVLGLPTDAVVFCCFNASFKITPAVFAIWMRLLKKIDGSVLWLYASRPAQANLQRQAIAHGVNPDRLIFAPPVDRATHLRRLCAADLFLDTNPYNAHNTACEAIAAGVPLITRSGRAFAARVATSVLTAAGLPELITTSQEEYEKLALELALDPRRRSLVRAKIHAGNQKSPLFDIDRYRRHHEAAYLAIWARHLDGEPPKTFAIPSLD